MVDAHMKLAVDPKDFPGSHLTIRAKIDMSMVDLGYVVHEQKWSMARQLAETIIKDNKFFREASYDNQYLDIRADCIVLTTEELERFALEQYRRGREAGMYMSTPRVYP